MDEVPRISWRISLWQMAIDANDTARCLAMLQHGVDPDDIDSLHGRPPLILAANIQNREICQLLLEHGANVNLCDNVGSTALHYAAVKGNLAICQMLLDWGAEAGAANCGGSAPLHWAVIQGNAPVAELLIGHGVDVDIHTDSGHTPLHFAVEQQDVSICRTLLRCGANPAFSPPGRVGDSYLTPFLTAIRNGNDDLVQLFFDSGRVNPRTFSAAGVTPATVAGKHASTANLVRALQAEYVRKQSPN